MLKNLVSLVTGGAGSLGSATVRTLAREEGAKVVFMDLPTSNGQEIANEIGDNVVFSEGDITNLNDIKKTLNLVKSDFGKLDVIVNCAALHCSRVVYRKKEFDDLTRCEEVVKTNILGTINVCRQGIMLMAENRADEDNLRGVIVNTSGFGSKDGIYGQVYMAACWGAIESMTMPLCREFAQVGVRVMTIAPGVMKSNLTRNLPQKLLHSVEVIVPGVRRLGKPEEYADIVKTIIQNRYLNGEVIKLNGGLRLNLGA